MARIGLDTAAQVMGSAGLACARDIVKLTFHGQQRAVCDVLWLHQLGLALLVFDVPGAVDQLVLLEHGSNRFQVVVGIHVQHGVVLVIELAVMLGAGVVTLDQVLEVVVVALGMAVRVHGHKARILQEAGVHTAACAGVVVRNFVDHVVLEPLKTAGLSQIVHRGGRAARINGAAHHGHGQRRFLAAAGHQRYGRQHGNGGLADADDVALAIAALQVANELLHIVHIVIQVEFTFGQRNRAGVFPVGDIYLVAAEHALHGVAQQGGVVAGQRGNNQHHGLAEHGLQCIGVIRKTLEAAQFAKRLVHFHSLADGDIHAVDFHSMQLELGLFIVLAQSIHQIEARRHALSQRQLAECRVGVVVELGRGLSKVSKWLDHCALHFVDLIQHGVRFLGYVAVQYNSSF